jgi:ribose 5-phosphate isomerase RpiB
MIFTQRQLEALHNGNGQLVLPYRARLSPLAQDWIRTKKIMIGYADIEPNFSPKLGAASRLPVQRPSEAGRFLWWCDGPCGPAKAAIAELSRQSNLSEIQQNSESRNLSAAVKELAAAVKSGQINGGIVLVKSGAATMVLANRCPSLRAVLGTCIDSLEQGLQQIAANVLVIEHPYQTLMQCKNLIGRFLRASRQLPEPMKRQLEEVASCG